MTTTTERQKAILGTLAINPTAFTDIADLVQPYMFENGTLQKLAELIWEKNREGVPYDTATLEKACDPRALSVIIDAMTSQARLTEHAVEVRDGFYTKQHFKFQQEMQNDIVNGSSYFNARSQYNAKIEAMLMGVAAVSNKVDRIAAVNELAARAMNDPDSLSGIPTPYIHMNEFSGGWQKGDYNIIGARPGMGKTTFLCEMALSAIQQDHPTVFFSMGDLTTESLYMKLACILAGLPMKAVRTGKINQSEYEKFAYQLELLSNWPIEVIDLKDCDSRVGAVCDRIQIGTEKDGWQLGIIDYVQQLRPDNNSLTGNAAYEQISQRIQKAAKSNDIPLLVASQLNRAVETRGGDKRTGMSDLRSSGAFEQDADGIMFLYRPGYYGIETDEEGDNVKFRTEVMVEKYRIAGDEVPATFNLEWRDQRLKQEEDDDFETPIVQIDNRISKTAGSDTDIPF